MLWFNGHNITSESDVFRRQHNTSLDALKGLRQNINPSQLVKQGPKDGPTFETTVLHIFTLGKLAMQITLDISVNRPQSQGFIFKAGSSRLID